MPENNKLRARVYNSKPASVREYAADFMANRYLLSVLAWQEIRGLYAQTYLGVLWVLLRPLLLTLIFTIFFTSLLHIQTQSPYYLFAFTGMVIWPVYRTATQPD